MSKIQTPKYFSFIVHTYYFQIKFSIFISKFQQEEYQDAFDLIKDLEPSVPQEYILKAVVQVTIGQETESVSI